MLLFDNKLHLGPDSIVDVFQKRFLIVCVSNKGQFINIIWQSEEWYETYYDCFNHSSP